jgi:DNA-binding MarR family transcriptional regulator
MNNTSAIYSFSIFTSKHRDILDKLMKEIGLHGGQFFVLFALGETDGLSQADLGKALNVSAPTVYNMVIRLADSGFVEIKKDERDARIMRVFLTEKGKEIIPKIEEQWQKMEQITFQNLTEPEKLMFTMLIEKIIAPN